MPLQIPGGVIFVGLQILFVAGRALRHPV